jgi:hypothetical protein
MDGAYSRHGINTKCKQNYDRKNLNLRSPLNDLEVEEYL